MMGPTRLLVIGQSGQLARALAETGANDPDVEIVCRGRPDVDLRDRESLTIAIDEVAPHLVINAAAWTDVDGAETDRESALAINTTGARWLADLTAGFGLPIIHVSTDCVFSGDFSQPYLESDACRPANWYGETKRRGELAVAGFNPKHLIVRTAWIHSPWGRNFVSTMLRLAAKGAPVRVVSDQIGQPTSARDLARALIHMAKSVDGVSVNDPRWGTYHVTNEGHVSRADQARAIFEASRRRNGPSVDVEPVASFEMTTPALRPLNSVLDGTRLYRNFALRLPGWRKSIDDTVEALLSAEGDAP